METEAAAPHMDLGPSLKARLPGLPTQARFPRVWAASLAFFAIGALASAQETGSEVPPADANGETSEREVLDTPPKQPPNLAKFLRRGQRPADSPPPTPGPKGPSRSPDSDDSMRGPRGWEMWWELHRDRYVQPRPRNMAIIVGLVPPDPRTSVQVEDALVGAFERIEPSLRLLLNYEKSELVLARALLSLAKLGEDPRVPGSRTTYAAILPYIRNSDAQLSEAAITALGILGTEEAIFPLGELAFGDRSSPLSARGRALKGSGGSSGSLPATDRQRALALYSIGLIGRDSPREDVRRLAVSRICELFSQDEQASYEVKFAALHALSLVPVSVETPPESPPAALDSKSKRPWTRVLARVQPPTIPSTSRGAEVDWVLSVLEDEGEAGWIRAQAVTAAARLCANLAEDSGPRRRVVERLIKALAPRSSDSVEVEQSAALALGELGDADNDELDARMRSALGVAISDASDQSTRRFALLGLSLVGSRAGGPARDSDRLSSSDDIRRLLLHRTASARSSELPWAVLALGIFEHGMVRSGAQAARESRAALTDLLVETKSAEHAAACSLALGLCGGTEARPELIARLRDGDSIVRGYAALALGLLGVREAAPGIEKLLDSARQAPELYRSASEALALLGAPVTRQLISMMVGGASLESQMSLCTALGRVGDGKSLHALSQLACDSTTLIWVRAAATSALGTLGARRPNPWNADLGHALNYTWLPATLSAPSLDGLLDLD